MKTIIKFLFTLLILFAFSCSQEAMLDPLPADLKAVSARATGATQISGVGFFALDIECDAGAQGADYAVRMTGDLEGCHYVFVDSWECSPSGTYRESGTEMFVGTYNGTPGTFETTYKFESKFEGCDEDGFPLGAEIFGRCQHPIVKGSGTGVFEGVTGRIDFKDDISEENFPYKGHLML